MPRSPAARPQSGIALIIVMLVILVLVIVYLAQLVLRRR